MKVTKITIILIFCLQINTTCFAQCKLSKAEWNLVFEENFDNISDISDLEHRWQFLPQEGDCYGWGTTIINKVQVIDNDGYEVRGEYYDKSMVELLPGVLRLKSKKLEIPKKCEVTYLDDNDDPYVVKENSVGFQA